MNYQSKMENFNQSLNPIFIKKTKEYMRLQVQNIFKNYQDDRDFFDKNLFELLKCHPHVIDKYIEKIDKFVLKNKHDLWLKYKDDFKESERISWRKCIENYLGYYSDKKCDKEKLTKIMRNEIQSDIDTFRYEKRFINRCECCNDENIIEWHIDHYQIPFVKIQKDFLNTHQNLNLEYNWQTDMFKIPETSILWKNYHNSISILRKICKKCNLSNGCYGYNKKEKSNNLRINFGKYNGTLIDDIFEKDPNYLKWVLNTFKPNVDNKKLLEYIKILKN